MEKKMHVTSDILYDALNEKWKLKRYGQIKKDQLLSLPVFYSPNMPLCQNKVYITRTHELPLSPNVSCLFLCIGSCPVNIWNDWPGEVIYIADSSADILSVFNCAQLVFENIGIWENKLQEILDRNADVEEMLRISIPVFNNRITIIDYELRIIAYCESTTVNKHREVRLCRTFDHVPHEKALLFDSIYARQTKEREPYFFKENNVDNYCINLYLGDIYMGCCSLMEDMRPIHNGDYMLFQHFASFIQRALLAQSKVPASPYATLKTIFSEILQNLPVSQSNLNHALDLTQKNSSQFNDAAGVWVCIVIRSANKGKNLPADYLCSSLEKLLPDCSTITYEHALVSFCRYNKAKICVSDFDTILTPYLQDMNFRAGISMPFENIFKSRSYYVQATNALQMGSQQDPQKLIYNFMDYALPYMLQHCIGEFEPELIFSPGLSHILHYKGGADYWETLKRYLDNECNASRTASEMYLHRSTLLPRLEKIKTFVDLNTPQQRLYLRMCIYLYEMQNQN